MTFHVSRLRDLTSHQYQQARSLNLRKRGFSRDHMRDCRRQRHEFSTIILAYEQSKLMGWVLLVQCLDEDGKLQEYSINFYVRKSVRRQGVGAALFAEMVEFLEASDAKGHVCIWSTDSERFYTCNKHRRIRVIVAPRYTLSMGD
jgi:GNAT superfamily N-acetyltransferase